MTTRFFVFVFVFVVVFFFNFRSDDPLDCMTNLLTGRMFLKFGLKNPFPDSEWRTFGLSCVWYPDWWGYFHFWSFGTFCIFGPLTNPLSLSDWQHFGLKRFISFSDCRTSDLKKKMYFIFGLTDLRTDGPPDWHAVPQKLGWIPQLFAGSQVTPGLRR